MDGEPGGRALSLASAFFAHWCVHPKSQALTHFSECFRLRLAVGFGPALASGFGAGVGSAVTGVGTLLADSLYASTCRSRSADISIFVAASSTTSTRSVT